MKSSARVVADSIVNLSKKCLIDMETPQQEHDLEMQVQLLPLRSYLRRR